MKVVTILIVVISTSLAARISDRGSRGHDATKQIRLPSKPSGSFDIQLQGGHISRVDFGSRDTKKEEPNRTQARFKDHRFSSQPTSKALSTSGSTRLQKRNPSSASSFNSNRQKTNSQLSHSSLSSVPSHFTIQQRNTGNPHIHFNPPAVDRPAKHRPISHFNIPEGEIAVEQKKPHNHFNPPVAVRPVHLDRPTNDHFTPATFHFGPPSPSKASSRRPDNFHRSSHSTSSTRRPKSSNRSSLNPSPRRPDSSHRTRVTTGPKRSQHSSNFDTNRPQTTSIFSATIPKGVNTSKFLPPKLIADDTNKFGPVDNRIQSPILSPNQPASAKDIPTIYYPINPKISPSNRVKA